MTGSPDVGQALEREAEGLYFRGEYEAAAARFEQAYAAYRREGRPGDAGRAARTLGWISGGVLGEWAVESGWLARARTELADAGPDGPEQGWLLILDLVRRAGPGRAGRGCCGTRSRSAGAAATRTSSSRRWHISAA